MGGRITTYLTVMTVAALLVVGCARVPESAICHTNPLKWSKSAQIEYHNTDTISLRDISFFARCNTSFNEQELPVTIRIEAPDSTFATERAVLRFDSKRSASPTATIENIGYRKDCILTQQGTYLFAILPDQPVRGVEAIGLIIEKQKK